MNHECALYTWLINMKNRSEAILRLLLPRWYDNRHYDYLQTISKIFLCDNNIIFHYYATCVI